MATKPVKKAKRAEPTAADNDVPQKTRLKRSEWINITEEVENAIEHTIEKTLDELLCSYPPVIEFGDDAVAPSGGNEPAHDLAQMSRCFR